jgi:hypothetical protein
MATLLTDTNTPIKNAKASFAPARPLTKKDTGEADTIVLAKVIKKMMISKRMELREA